MNSINLLPKHIKSDLEQAKKNRKSLGYLLKSVLWIVVVGIIITLCWYYYTVQISDISALTERKNNSIDRFDDIEDKSQDIADRLETIGKIENKLNHWSPLVTEIQTTMPGGAYLSSVKIDSDEKNRSEISGYAETKSTVASLRDLLENSDKFEYVNIEKSTTSEDPVSNEELENFILTFALTKEALNE